MEFQKYMRNKRRMINATKKGLCGIKCTDCPLGTISNRADMTCVGFEVTHPDKAEAVVQAWIDEHPEKTILQDFLEKYPNATMSEGGLPRICPWIIGYEAVKNPNVVCAKEGRSCNYCWNRPLSDLGGSDE